MVKSKTKQPKRKEVPAVETDPGAWGRFEHAVDAAVKSGPKHRTATGKIVPPKRRGSKPKPEKPKSN